MMASVIKRSLIAVLFFTATIFVQQCLSEGRPTVQDNFLLVAAKPNLYQIDLASGAIVSLLATPRYGIVAVAYDPVEMVVYWTDVEEGLIGKDRLNGSWQYSTIIFQNPMGKLPLDGLALDIENRKLYYADAGLSPKIVEMNLDGSRPVTIVNGAGMKPRALVLDTEKRRLYYTDWGYQPGIYVINLSTRQSTTILINNFTWPNALAIDFTERVMYWADAALHRVEMANLDGSGRVTLVNDLSAHYYAMALSSQYLYITDWYHNAVKRLDRKTYTTSEQMPNVAGQLYGLVYYNSSFARDTKKPTDGTTLEPVNYKSTTNNGTKILGDGATGKNSSAPQIESTTVIIAATVAGGVVLMTGMITLTVCCITKRKRAPVVEEPHYMTTVTSSQSSGDKASEAYINLNPYETIEDDYI